MSTCINCYYCFCIPTIYLLGGKAEIADCIHLGFCTMWEIQKNTCPYATTIYV